MPLKYGDQVILIQQSLDGSVRRVNATVIRSVTQAEGGSLKTSERTLYPAGEYLDLVFPRELQPGQENKAITVDQIFQWSYTTPPSKDGARGWTPLPAPVSPEAKKLRAFLFANFKNETGNETPEACAIRLLKKLKG